jgi:hypothetical protein
VSDEVQERHAVPDLPHPPEEHGHRDATELAQRVLRGESKPPMPLLVSFGAPLDMESGLVRCPRCGMDSIQVVQAVSYPAVSFPTNAAIMLGCRTCGTEFAVGIDQEGGQAYLRTTRPR